MTMIIIRILMGLEAIVCLLLIGIVLIQRSKGQGVGLSFGGGAEAVFGAQMGNVLTRTTVVLGVIFLFNTAVLAVLKPTQRGDSLSERMAPSTSEAVQAPATTAEDLAAALGPDAVAPAPEAVDATTTDVEGVSPEAETVVPAAEAIVPAPAVVAPAVVVPAPTAPATEAVVPAVVVPAKAPTVVVPATTEPAAEAPAEPK